VFDEAHEIEDVAGQHFGIQVSNYRFDELTRDVQSVALEMEFGTNELHRILDACRARSTAFFALFENREGRTGFNDRAGFVKRFEHQYQMVLNALELLGTHLKLPARLRVVGQDARGLAGAAGRLARNPLRSQGPGGRAATRLSALSPPVPNIDTLGSGKPLRRTRKSLYFRHS
jgi:hypothetical protein